MSTDAIRALVADRRVLIVGLGKSGVAAARLLHSLGAHVFITDEKTEGDLSKELREIPPGIRFEKVLRPLGSDLIIVSPGIPWDLPELVEARKSGIPIWPELELGWRCLKPGKTVAITGTNGKTTTTAMIAHLLTTAGRPVELGGNIGTPLCDLVGKVTEKTILVLEVSSYQLEAHQTFHPNVGLLLNITPDHLKRHGTMAGYAKAKGRLFLHFGSGDTAILNKNDAWCTKIGESVKGKKVWFPSPALKNVASHIQLPGEHNLENAMAAVAAVQALGLKNAEIASGLATFKGVPHRIEVVGVRGGVMWVNDSKATNVDSTSVALKSFSKPTILILGGQHKGSPYTPLKPLLKKNVKEILTIGEAARIISKDLKSTVPVTSCRTLDRAVHYASLVARPGDIVLLSPACASFDQFNNFEHRGDHFSKLVRNLAQ